MSKSIIFLVKSFLGNFCRHLAIFIWSHWLWHSWQSVAASDTIEPGFELSHQPFSIPNPFSIPIYLYPLYTHIISYNVPIRISRQRLFVLLAQRSRPTPEVRIRSLEIFYAEQVFGYRELDCWKDKNKKLYINQMGGKYKLFQEQSTATMVQDFPYCWGFFTACSNVVLRLMIRC